VLPGSGQQPLDLETARQKAAEIGYPVLLKAASGGGIGMQAVTDPKLLEKAFSTAQNRAKSAFGRADLYLEQYLVSPHHIEVQVLGDTHSNLLHLYDRECSIQRRHQKVIEEAPPSTWRSRLRPACASA
jgi:acetyl-CoA carboxylase biotin carboxylase subunit